MKPCKHLDYDESRYMPGCTLITETDAGRTDTPEVDALEFSLGHDRIQYVRSNDARRLERERDQAREALFGSFLIPDGDGGHKCAHCDWQIPILEWTTAEHEPDCIINVCKAVALSGRGRIEAVREIGRALRREEM